jgi:hypothetical protein
MGAQKPMISWHVVCAHLALEVLPSFLSSHNSVISLRVLTGTPCLLTTASAHQKQALSRLDAHLQMDSKKLTLKLVKGKT